MPDETEAYPPIADAEAPRIFPTDLADLDYLNAAARPVDDVTNRALWPRPQTRAQRIEWHAMGMQLLSDQVGWTMDAPDELLMPYFGALHWYEFATEAERRLSGSAGDAEEIGKMSRKVGAMRATIEPRLADAVRDESMMIPFGPSGIEPATVQNWTMPGAGLDSDPGELRQMRDYADRIATMYGIRATVAARLWPDGPDDLRVSREQTNAGIAEARRDRLATEYQEAHNDAVESARADYIAERNERIAAINNQQSRDGGLGPMAISERDRLNAEIAAVSGPLPVTGDGLIAPVLPLVIFRPALETLELVDTEALRREKNRAPSESA